MQSDPIDNSNLASNQRKIHDCFGFTMIETLLAVALSAILMVSVLGLIGSLRPVSPETHLYDELHDQRLAKFIQEDLIKAYLVEVKSDGMVIYTYRALRTKTLEPTHRPVIVQYRIVDYAGSSWLVRDQTHADAQHKKSRDWSVRTALLCDIEQVMWSLSRDEKTEGTEGEISSIDPPKMQHNQGLGNNDYPDLFTRSDLPPLFRLDLYTDTGASIPSRSFVLHTGTFKPPTGKDSPLDEVGN